MGIIKFVCSLIILFKNVLKTYSQRDKIYLYNFGRVKAPRSPVPERRIVNYEGKQNQGKFRKNK